MYLQSLLIDLMHTHIFKKLRTFRSFRIYTTHTQSAGSISKADFSISTPFVHTTETDVEFIHHVSKSFFPPTLNANNVPYECWLWGQWLIEYTDVRQRSIQRTTNVAELMWLVSEHVTAAVFHPVRAQPDALRPSPHAQINLIIAILCPW